MIALPRSQTCQRRRGTRDRVYNFKPRVILNTSLVETITSNASPQPVRHLLSSKSSPVPSNTFPWHIKEVDVDPVLRHAVRFQSICHSTLDLSVVCHVYGSKRVYAAKSKRGITSTKYHRGIVSDAYSWWIANKVISTWIDLISL